MALLGATTAQVGAVMVIIARYLFPETGHDIRLPPPPAAEEEAARRGSHRYRQGRE
jgi:hypothetical protein